jgi:hypothetical protein
VGAPGLVNSGAETDAQAFVEELARIRAEYADVLSDDVFGGLRADDRVSGPFANWSDHDLRN